MKRGPWFVRADLLGLRSYTTTTCLVYVQCGMATRILVLN